MCSHYSVFSFDFRLFLLFFLKICYRNFVLCRLSYCMSPASFFFPQFFLFSFWSVLFSHPMSSSELAKSSCSCCSMIIIPLNFIPNALRNTLVLTILSTGPNHCNSISFNYVKNFELMKHRDKFTFFMQTF
jgi:hypothetical protein